jgi:hypothetical protein
MCVCEVCNNADVEDEFHFVIVCPACHMLRVKYIKPFYFKHPSVFKFIELMQSEKVATLNKLGRFVHEAFAVRLSLL